MRNICIFFFLLSAIVVVINGQIYCATCSRGVTVSICECGNGGSPIPSPQGYCCSSGHSNMKNGKSGIIFATISLIFAYVWSKTN